MKVSLNLIRELTGLELPPVDQLVDRLNRQLGGVEQVIDLGERYRGIVIVRVVTALRYDKSDHLYICKVDDAGATPEIERDSDGYVQVLTGADNVHDGMMAVWIPPGSFVPDSFETLQPFQLESRKMLGEVSHGMLASFKELGLGSEHSGIIELTAEDFLAEGSDLQQLVIGDKGNIKLDDFVGKDFAETFGLDDTILDFENKMFTHRPDLFGVLGIAREFHAIFTEPAKLDKPLDTPFVEPDWYRQAPKFSGETEQLELEVFNQAPLGSQRFMAAAVDGVQVAPSPLWLRCQLARLGAKSINNIVDATNLMMLISAQPTHAYDYDKLAGHKLGVRMAHDGEEAKLLNGKDYKLSTDDIVIVDGDGVVGLAGVMGGLESEVTDQTTRIALEVANFDMYAVRRTSMRYGLFTDALTRFNKGQSPLQNDRVMFGLARLIELVSGGQLASQVFDEPAGELSDAASSEGLLVDSRFISSRLGVDLSPLQISNILRAVNFEVTLTEGGDNLLVSAPFWRTDIGVPEDIVEEIGRLYGYHKLPSKLPERSIKPVAKNQMFELKHTVRSNLARFGASEALGYSFVSASLLEKADQDSARAFQISNALSPDLQFYRLSIVPSLLDKVHPNIKAGFDEFALFEIGKPHDKSAMDDHGLPAEFNHLGFVYARKDQSEDANSGASFYQAREYLARLADSLRVSLELRADEQLDELFGAPFEPNRSATVYLNGVRAGVVGEFKSSVRRGFKLPVSSAGFEIDLDLVLELQPTVRGYSPLAKFPKVTQDVTLDVPVEVPFAELDQLVQQFMTESTSDGINLSASPKVIYRRSDTEPTKQVTYHIDAVHDSRTLKDAEVNDILEQLKARLAQKF